MKNSNLLSSTLLLQAVSNVIAFPSGSLAKFDLNTPIGLNELKSSPGPINERSLLSLQTLLAEVQSTTQVIVNQSVFDPERQKIDTTGEHEFRMPDYANGDVRGPCPGLNVLANYGYLPRNGFATILEYIKGVEILGMGSDTALVLAIYGTVLGGNPFSLTPGVSIGPASDSAESQNLLGNLGGLFGTPRGITGTHNIFEVDASITRSDLYDSDGDNNDMNMEYFMQLYNMQKDAEEPNYTIDVFLDHSLNRFNHSIATNPNFYYGPWSGWFVRNAAYCFGARILRNASEEYPDGYMNKETLKAFWGVSGPEENMTYTRGSEHFPDNYYRPANDYGAAALWVDVIEKVTLARPELLSFGGNTNGVNTFTGFNLENITGGVVNAAYLAKGNNAMCFAFQILEEVTPNILGSLYATAEPVVDLLLNLINLPLTQLECDNDAFKNLGINGQDFLSTIKNTYPGAAKSGIFV